MNGDTETLPVPSPDGWDLEKRMHFRLSLRPGAKKPLLAQ